MNDDRMTHLREISPALWPPPHVTRISPPTPDARAGVVEQFLLLPSRHHPRLLTPTGRRQAAAVVRHYGEGRDRTARLKARALAAGLRIGLGPLVCRERWLVTGPVPSGAPTLRTHLSEVLGQEIVVGLHLGPPRANRKPVLQLVDVAGRTVGYAKLGVDELTDGLLRTEAAALTELATVARRTLVVAPLLHTGDWAGHELLVQGALPVWSSRRPLTEQRLHEAATEIAAIGRTDGVRLSGARFAEQLSDRIDALPQAEPRGRLEQAVRRLVGAAGDTALSTGAAHGDWTPWNMASVREGLLVWDWERFRHDVPVGFDLLHHRLQTDLVARLHDPAEAARSLVDGAPALLQPLQVAPDAAVVTAVLYGLDLATRYTADRQKENGARLGDVGAWLLPALDLGLAQIERTRR